MQRMDAVAKQSPWLVSQCYDLSFITFSAIFLFLPHLVHTITGSNVAVDIAISVLIGGPHLFATYTMTLMEPQFRQRYPRYTWGAIAMPVLVVTTAIVNLDLLVTVFSLLSALHVIHQEGYVADSYRAKAGTRSGDRWTVLGTITDYGLLAASLFVLATFRFTGTSLQMIRKRSRSAGISDRWPGAAVPGLPSQPGAGMAGDRGVGAICCGVSRHLGDRGAAAPPERP